MELPLREILGLIVDQDVETNDICPFKNLVTVHFARWVILEKAQDAHGKDIPASLILSTNYDGPLEKHLSELVDVAGGGLNEIFQHCLGYPPPGQRSRAAVLRFIRSHRISYGAFYVGLAGRSVEMVDREEGLRATIQIAMDEGHWSDTAVGREPARIVESIRALLDDKPSVAWVKEERSWFERLGSTAGWAVILAAAVAGGLGLFGVVLYTTLSQASPWFSEPGHWLPLIGACFTVAVMVSVWAPAAMALAARLVGVLLLVPLLTPILMFVLWIVSVLPGVAFRSTLLPVALAPFVVVGLLLLAIRVKEARDEQTDVRVNPKLVRSIRDLTRAEDHVVQNQLTHLVNIKPGPLRLVTLRLFLTVINLVARHFQRDGTLGGIGSIHFARWCIIDGGRRLIFFSNFDGSWEEYLGDFVDRASWGLTGIWSNTVGYPKTRWLVFDGAKDEQRFKLWGREHQIPTQVWYSRRKRLTLKNIVNNKAIRTGLYAPLGRQRSREWLRRL